MYIDDILISTETEEEHMKLLEETLDRITAAGLKPSLKKMELGKHEVDFLGFKLGKDTKTLTTSTRNKLEEMKRSGPPKSRKQLQSLLGTLNYIRELIPKYSREARVLYQGTKEGPWRWTEQMENARLNLIEMALSSGELDRRDETVPLEVCVCEREQEVTLTLSNRGGKAPIAFLTHTQEAPMLKYEENGPERILAAVSRRILQLKAFAKEQPIVIHSMAGELTRLKKNLVMNQARIHSLRWDQWGLVLADMQLEWKIIKQKRKDKMTKYHDKHEHLPKYFTDGSERKGKVKWGYLVKQDGDLVTSESGEIAGTAQLAEVMAVSKALERAVALGHKEIVVTCDSEYVADGINKELETWKSNGFHTARNKPMKHKDEWVKIAGLLEKVCVHCYHQVSHTKQLSEAAQGNREVDKMIGEVKLKQVHDLFTKLHDELNHPSYNMIQMELRLRNLNIPNWRDKYRQVKKQCEVCRKFMTAKGAKESHLPQEYAGQEVSIDFAGPLRPKTKNGNCYFLLAIDNHTKMKMVWPMSTALEKNVVECLKEWIKWQGKMESLRADGAHNVSGKLVEDFCRENKIVLTKSIAYRPETNGIAERAIREVKEWLRKNENLGEWDQIIDKCLSNLNRFTREESREREVKENPRFRVGDEVIITRRRKVGKFSEGSGVIDKVISITGSNTVELENNGVQSNKDLIKN